LTDIAVIHLVWTPLGPEPIARFAASYRQHAAGIDHRLVVIFKFGNDADLARLRAPLAGLEFESISLPGQGLDVAAYRRAVDLVDATYVCFLNSNSEVLATDWLAHLARHAAAPGVGLVGATGSCEATGQTVFRSIVSRGQMVPFPNPHVRSNAFMLARDLARELDWPFGQTKTEAWQFEGGPCSLTRQVDERGLDVLVVGRDGVAYPRERWYESATFRSGDQANLLIADNRTREYAQASPAERQRLAALAWGIERVMRTPSTGAAAR
jgi:hypothetical protein